MKFFPLIESRGKCQFIYQLSVPDARLHGGVATIAEAGNIGFRHV